MSNELVYQNGLKQISSNLHAPGRQVVGHDRIASMEGSRAYAIILVFLVHFMSHYFDRYNGTNFDSFHISNATSFVDFMGYYFWASHYGVDLFFLLSGFLIFRILARLDFRYFQFLLGRLLRLYPAFLFAFALQIFYAAYFWDKTFDASTIAANLFFLHGIFELKIPAVLVPTWSLAFEWLFYIVFPVLILGLCWWRPISLGHILVSAAVTMVIVGPVGPHYVRFLMFFVGALLASLSPSYIESWIHKISDGPVIAISVLVNLIFVAAQNFYIFTWPFAATSFMLVARAIYGRGILNRVFSFDPLRKLGNISYSFYLLHGLVIIAMVDHVGPLLGKLPYAAQFGLLISMSFIASIVMATASFRLFEKVYFVRKARLHLDHTR